MMTPSGLNEVAEAFVIASQDLTGLSRTEPLICKVS